MFKKRQIYSLVAALLIILPNHCRVCDTERVVMYLKTQFPGLTVSYLYYPQAAAKRAIKYFGIKALPAYFLTKEVEKEKSFENLKNNLEAKGDFYMLRPQFAGLAYFLDRKSVKGKLDVFFSLYGKDTAQILAAIEEFKPTLHFLAVWQQDRFDALQGNLEVEEYLRSVCVQKYYPQKFWDYIGCRAKSLDTSWWQDCLGQGDASQIKTCARGEEGKTLLKENIALNKELEIMFGPTYLLDNQEIFATPSVPAKEELRKLIKR